MRIRAPTINLIDSDHLHTHPPVPSNFENSLSETRNIDNILRGLNASTCNFERIFNDFKCGSKFVVGFVLTWSKVSFLLLIIPREY